LHCLQGGEKEKKKVMRASEKFRFNFDWDGKEDTSKDLNPLYNQLHREWCRCIIAKLDCATAVPPSITHQTQTECRLSIFTCKRVDDAARPDSAGLTALHLAGLHGRWR
jgi:hypothetical protein